MNQLFDENLFEILIYVYKSTKMASLKYLIFYLTLKCGIANVFYGFGCEELVKRNKPFSCVQIPMVQFRPCFVPKPGNRLTGCLIDTNQGKM